MSGINHIEANTDADRGSEDLRVDLSAYIQVMDWLTNRSASIEQSDMKMHLFALPNLDNIKSKFCVTHNQLRWQISRSQEFKDFFFLFWKKMLSYYQYPTLAAGLGFC